MQLPWHRSLLIFLLFNLENVQIPIENNKLNTYIRFAIFHKMGILMKKISSLLISLSLIISNNSACAQDQLIEIIQNGVRYTTRILI